MKVLVLLVLVLVSSGCHAGVLRKHHPKQQEVHMVKDAFWDYVAKATATAEDSLRQIRESELGRELNSLISESTSAVHRISDALRTKVAPLTYDLMSQFSQEAERLKLSLEKDLSAARVDLRPYAEELLADLQRQLEELKKQADPVDPEALKVVLLQLKQQLDQSVSRLQAHMVPYSEEVKEKVEQSVEEFQRSVTPLTQSLEEFQRSVTPLTQSLEAQLSQKTLQVQQSLVQRGQELRASLDADVHTLKTRLTALWESFTKITQ